MGFLKWKLHSRFSYLFSHTIKHTKNNEPGFFRIITWSGDLLPKVFNGTVQECNSMFTHRPASAHFIAIAIVTGGPSALPSLQLAKTDPETNQTLLDLLQ